MLAQGCATTRHKPGAHPAPNLVFVFADQWRAQATGYAGDPNVKTPHLDRLAGESLNLTHAVACTPVCSPYRGCLITGQYPHKHGIFLNDVPLSNKATSFAQALGGAGYHTGYIGKWHLDGHGRSSFIPQERRQGFDYWRVLECTHDYNRSKYFAEENVLKQWEGYDAIAQTRDAQQYIRAHANTGPFALFLSWGPPHNPYETAPREFKDMYRPEALTLRKNVPAAHEAAARKDLAGYYAHCSALDACTGDLLATLNECGIADNTIFVFTSDHGDMLESQGEQRKQRPWDESIRIPFLVRYPNAMGRNARESNLLINSPDIMPTMLGLCGIDTPTTAQGHDYSAALRGEKRIDVEAALLACYHPFGEWTREKGGREFRGVRTHRHTYIKSLDGAWLLYDSEKDPFQLENLAGRKGVGKIQTHLDGLVKKLLEEVDDDFRPGDAYVGDWGYKTDANGTAPYAG